MNENSGEDGDLLHNDQIGVWNPLSFDLDLRSVSNSEDSGKKSKEK